MTSAIWREQEWELTDSGIALAPMIRLAQLAKRGVDANEMDGLAALGDCLQTTLASDAEYDRLMDYATRERLDGDELMEALQVFLAVIAARPTRRPSESSDGPVGDSPRSTGDSVSRVLNRYDGRPDLQLAVVQAQEARVASVA